MAITVRELFDKQRETERTMQVGDLVHANWSAGSFGHFGGMGKIVKINPKSILVELTEDVKYYGQDKIAYPKGHRINVPRVLNHQKWSGIENFHSVSQCNVIDGIRKCACGCKIGKNESEKASDNSYPEAIYTAFNKNFTNPKSKGEIDGIDYLVVRTKASENLDKGKEQFDELFCTHIRTTYGHKFDNDGVDEKKLLSHLYKEHHGAFDFADELEKTLGGNAEQNSKKIIDLWNRELKHHFFEEEQYVFPKIMSVNPSKRADVENLIRFHRDFEKTIESVKNKKDKQSVLKFASQLKKHIVDEEKLFKILMDDPYKMQQGGGIERNLSPLMYAKHFAMMLQEKVYDYFRKEHPALMPPQAKEPYDLAKISIKEGAKYIRIDKGNSGKFMLDTSDLHLYFIKGYGVIDKKKDFGDIRDIIDYDFDYNGYSIVTKGSGKKTTYGYAGKIEKTMSDGGMSYGKRHSQCDDNGCGVKYDIGGTGRIVELEGAGVVKNKKGQLEALDGGEGVIKVSAMDDENEYIVKGNPRTIASCLNEMHGGKNFRKEGTECEIVPVKTSGSRPAFGKGGRIALIRDKFNKMSKANVVKNYKYFAQKDITEEQVTQAIRNELMDYYAEELYGGHYRQEGGDIISAQTKFIDPKQLGNFLKAYFKQKYNLDVKTRYIKTVRGLDGSWYEVRVANFGIDVIPNEFRKWVLQQTNPKANPRNWDDINYGNIKSNSVSLHGREWSKLFADKMLLEGKIVDAFQAGGNIIKFSSIQEADWFIENYFKQIYNLDVDVSRRGGLMDYNYRVKPKNENERIPDEFVKLVNDKLRHRGYNISNSNQMIDLVKNDWELVFADNFIVDGVIFQEGGGVQAVQNELGLTQAQTALHLPFEIGVYVPSTKEANVPVTKNEFESRITNVKKFLAENFGGFTSSQTAGGYVSRSGELIQEDVVKVTSFSSKESFEANKQKLIDQIGKWAKEWSQEAIGLEFEGDLYYVTETAQMEYGGSIESHFSSGEELEDFIKTFFWQEYGLHVSVKIGRLGFECNDEMAGHIVVKITDSGKNVPDEFKELAKDYGWDNKTRKAFMLYAINNYAKGADGGDVEKILGKLYYKVHWLENGEPKSKEFTKKQLSEAREFAHSINKKPNISKVSVRNHFKMQDGGETTDALKTMYERHKKSFKIKEKKASGEVLMEKSKESQFQTKNEFVQFVKQYFRQKYGLKVFADILNDKLKQSGDFFKIEYYNVIVSDWENESFPNEFRTMVMKKIFPMVKIKDENNVKGGNINEASITLLGEEWNNLFSDVIISDGVIIEFFFRGGILKSVQKEMEQVKRKAVAEGNWLKAPNGEMSRLDEDEWALIRTDTFKSWFGDWQKNPSDASKVLGADGEPMIVYHGTTHKFTEFTLERANIENDFGKGYYASNSYYDVERNYASKEGADLTSRISRLAERIEQDEEIPYEQAKVKAKKQLIGKQERILPLFLNIRNPFIIDGKHGTFLELETGYDEEAEEYGDESGELVDFFNAIRQALWGSDYYDVNPDEIISDLYEQAIGRGGLYAEDLVKVMKESRGLMDATDSNGNLINHQFISECIQKAGFDGIIDKSVSRKFLNMGLAFDTTHYICFSPYQLKSADKNKGTFRTDTPNIFMQAGGNIDSEYFKMLIDGYLIIKEKEGQFLDGLAIQQMAGELAKDYGWDNKTRKAFILYAINNYAKGADGGDVEKILGKLYYKVHWLENGEPKSKEFTKKQLSEAREFAHSINKKPNISKVSVRNHFKMQDGGKVKKVIFTKNDFDWLMKNKEYYSPTKAYHIHFIHYSPIYENDDILIAIWDSERETLEIVGSPSGFIKFLEKNGYAVGTEPSLIERKKRFGLFSGGGALSTSDVESLIFPLKKLVNTVYKNKNDGNYYRIVTTFGQDITALLQIKKVQSHTFRAKMGERTITMELSDFGKGLRDGKYQIVEQKAEGGSISSDRMVETIGNLLRNGEDAVFMDDLKGIGFNPQKYETDSPYVFNIGGQYELYKNNYLDSRYFIKTIN